MATPGPYATGADAYWRAGWRGIVPLPHKAKKNPPTGYTGENGVDPSYADVDAWATGPEGGGNIALRLPRNVVGIDVDAYGDKLGRQTVQEAEARLGALPPTWRTTSRDDGVSGIRLYRVPEGLAWPGEIGHSTELIQHGHRYAVVWPSVHPEGRTYRWIGPDGVVTTTVPDVDVLPALPDAWVEAYTRGELAATTNRNNAPAMVVAAWLTGLDHAQDPQCARMEAAVDQMRADLKGSAHNSARDASLRAIRLADEGHHGLLAALSEMRAMFVRDATHPDRRLLGKATRTEGEAAREWADLLTSAANLVTANPSGIKTCDCYGDITGLIVGAAAPAVAGSLALDTTPEPATVAKAETQPDPTEAPSRLKDGATFILDAPAEVPAIWGAGDEVYWTVGEALMIVGPPGVGKTTLTGQLVRGLLGLDRAVLGMHVAPTAGRVLYLAMDRPAQIARALRRGFNESERGVLADSLRVWEGPPPGDIAKHTDLLVTLAHLAGATCIIIDSLKDAAVGLTEDEIGAGYNRARQTALANGIQVLELHHLVKRGANGNKPNTLADVYGSAWLTAGAGSVLMLWGSAGDPIVEAVHLKQPAAEVGPYRLLHDHANGTTSFVNNADLAVIVAAAGPAGITAKDAAKGLYQSDKPSQSEVEKTRQKLDRMATGEGASLACIKGSRGGDPTRWIVAQIKSRSNQGHPSQSTPDLDSLDSDLDSLTSTNAAKLDSLDYQPTTKSRPSPPLKGDGRVVSRIVAGEAVTVNLETGEILDTADGVG